MLAIASALLGNKWFVYGLAGLGIFVAIWTTAFYKGQASIDIPSIERAAYANGQVARDGEWKIRLAAASRDADARVAEWQRKAEEAETASPTPTTTVELENMCKTDVFCRKL